VVDSKLRYLLFNGSRLLGGLGFGASAWSLADRDRFIGWSSSQRQRNLHLVLNNHRFLLLPIRKRIRSSATACYAVIGQLLRS
jgi:Domain of unknown function (DUF4338)